MTIFKYLSNFIRTDTEPAGQSRIADDSRTVPFHKSLPYGDDNEQMAILRLPRSR